MRKKTIKSTKIFSQEYYSIDPKSLGQLANLKKIIDMSKQDSIGLKARFFRPYCVAYLNQVLWTINEKRKVKVFSIDSNLNSYLKQSGFEFLSQEAQFGELFPQENIITIRRFKDAKDLDSKVIKWLENIVYKFIPNCSQQLRKKIVQSLWEILNNGFTHGKSKYGISSCGQYYPKKKYFEIAFYDSGYGLANRVWDYKSGKLELLNDSDCIEWAAQKGNSTLQNPDAGLGLFLLREFLKVNQGAFQIIAGKGYFGNMEEEIDIKHTLRNSIDGTLVNIRVNISENIIYKLKGEENENY
ncbi:MAG: hypothetical protein KJ799_03800 [Bacteroidetes bacterium]|nr:hypothetical protein [Bacteroidota bacterium]MBU2505832.1 hypothetical protein [Bacteroidota bacterium]